MEVDTMVLSDDGSTTHTTLKRNRPQKRPNKRKFTFLQMGFVCLAIAFLAILSAVIIVRTVPSTEKSTVQMSKKEDNEEIAFKAIFTTNNTLNTDTQSINIENLDEIANELNIKLSGKKIHLIGAVFHKYSLSNGYSQRICENPLSGNILQLNIIVLYSRQCIDQNENICKIQREEQLRNMFKRMLIIPINIRFNNNHYKTIYVQICNLSQIKGTENDNENRITKTPIRRKVKKLLATSRKLPAEPGKYISRNVVTPLMVLKQSRCSLNLGRISLVQMSGEFQSRIYDDIRTNIIGNNREELTVMLYEEMTYRIQVQIECNKQSGGNVLDDRCDLSENVKVWIDLNDNEYDDGESRLLQYTRANPSNTYDLELYIPPIDGRNIRSVSHRMRVSVIPNEEYQRECGTVQYPQTRDYTVNIFPKATYSGVVDTRPVNPVVRNPICSENIGKLSLVLMAGERGTEIRDDKGANVFVNDYPSKHHLAVTIYEHTIYLLRVQLDCSWQLDSDLFAHGCNLAQDVKVWIDLNDDGRFDPSEVGTPYLWPVTSYMPRGIYDLQLYIPSIDGRYMRNGQHRMRLSVMSSQHYRTMCGRSDYNETRDYTVNIIPRTGYAAEPDVVTPYISLDNVVCSPHIGKVVLVLMAGEHRTQIRDDPSTRSGLIIDNRNERRQSIVLFEDVVYLLRIQLDCNQQWTNDMSEYNCNLIYDVNIWIDLNDDGIFDTAENAVPFRWPLHSYTPKGIYDLQIHIPVADTRRTKPGPYHMQLVVTMNEQYRRKCGNNDYKETRDYTVSIVPHTLQPIDVKLPYIALSDDVCSLQNGKVSLVLMAGEQGTHIRDNIVTNTLLNENQNRHHLSVTLYENTIYRLRIQLDCYQISGGGLPDINCNFAQDVDVSIDLNNDGRFDETEDRVPQRWPLRSSMPLGVYDFQIEIPSIDRRNTINAPHRMRILVVPSEEYRSKCGKSDYRETREYTINIIPRTIPRELEYQYETDRRIPPSPDPYLQPEYQYKPDRRIPPSQDSRGNYCPVGSLSCSIGSSGISMVKFLGEHNTQIYDEMKKCNSLNNYHDRTNLYTTLFQNTVYTLHIELYCVQSLNNDQDPLSTRTKCNSDEHLRIWIDFNNDGIFNENQEVIENNQYQIDQRTSEYNIRITIPQIDQRKNFNGQFRMRLILTPDERNRKPCYNAGYGEARDYTVQILPKPDY